MILPLLILALSAEAHISMWNVGLFGYNSPWPADYANQSYNTNDPVIPLKQIDNRTIAQWWGHGMLDMEPKKGDFMNLPSGGIFVGELACNRADTKLRDPVRNDAQPEFACSNSSTSDGIGALHVVNNSFDSKLPLNESWFGGTAIAIAYTSDIVAVKPSDMTIISVNYTSPWKRLTNYPIPAGLPPCPTGGCLCTWNWLHQGGHGEGYPWEMYNNIYRCNVTNATGGMKVTLGGGQIPQNCVNSTSTCIKGPKQPLYAYQLEGNNQPFTDQPPTYNARYGFSNGAQTDALIVDTSYTPSSTNSIPSATGLLPTSTGFGNLPTPSIRPSAAVSRFSLSALWAGAVLPAVHAVVMAFP